ncbi:glycosyltransferase family 2 protein [Yeosuana marina]|uniref:glycosyltransferase family 2 protein n=1 Tax=Yeosuana marina TaxID=1565536 RepID=UPI0030EE2583|tara:strand:- start:1074 stop:1991 length:918 start_codon:yes stop_codon:yes gene_type:complete
MDKPKFTITIPTYNRPYELKFTLKKIEDLLIRKDVVCIICDDASTDNTCEYVSQTYPNIKILKNEKTRGIHYTRNRLLNDVETPFILSLDDDAHIISDNTLGIIEHYFNNNPHVGLLSFRAYWDKGEPHSIHTKQKPIRVKSFGAVSFAMRTEALKEIPNFLNWFVFYGEEDFVAFHLFKKGWEIHYIPEVLVHHRVNIKERKKNKDYHLRLRRSLRSGWYLYILFYPLKTIPKRFMYTLYIQIKSKVLKTGDFKAFFSILHAILDLFINFPRLIKNSNRLTKKEFSIFNNLAEPILYWTPEEEK